MKKFLYGITILLIFFTLTAPSYAQQMQANAKTNRIPRGQKIELRVIDPITTENVQKGDIFTASLTKDIEIDGDIVLPAGSLVRGNVGRVIPPKRLSRSAIMYLNFDHVVNPTGQQLPIKAGVCSNFIITDDGAIQGGENYKGALKKNWKNTKNIVKKSTKWGVDKGEKLFNGGKYLLTPFAAAGGAIGGGFYYVGSDIVDLFKKGNNIIINQGETFSILLLDNLDIPIW